MEKGSRKRSSTTEGKGQEHIKCVISEFEDVLVPSSFLKDKVHGYVCDHAESYVTDNYDKEEVKAVIEYVKKEKVEGLQAIPEDGKKEEVVKGTVEHVKALLGKSCCYKLDALVHALLQSALDKKDLSIQLHEGVSKCLEGWKGKGLKMVVLTNRSEPLVRSILLGGCPGLNEADVEVESLGESPASVKESYVALADKLKLPPAHVCFLTRCQNEAVAASAAGMEATLVQYKVDADSEKDKQKDSQTDKKGAHAYSVVHSLQEVLKGEEVPRKQTCPPLAAAAAEAHVEAAK